MKLLWHICKKDFVHLRLALGLWVLLLGGEIFFNLRLLSPAGIDREWFDRAGLLVNLLALTTGVVSYLMMASLVLEDPAVGTQMFWATRPISGGRLLGAKLLGILLAFGVLPILVWLPWWLYCGYGWRDLGPATLQSLSSAGVLAVPAVVLGALSGQSSRFLLYSLLLLVAFPLLSLLVASRAIPFFKSDLIMTHVLLAVLLCAISGVAAAVSQFVTRRLVRSVAILSAGVALAAVCLFTRPWRLSQLWRHQEPRQTATEPIEAEMVDASLLPLKSSAAPGNTNLTLTLRLKNLPADRILLAGFADAELRWSDGFTVRQPHLKMRTDMGGDRQALYRLLALPSARSDPETVAKLADLREERLRQRPAVVRKNHPPRTPALGAEDILCVFNLPMTPEVAARIRAESPVCSVSARLTLGRPEVLFEMPLRTGATQSGHGARLNILDLTEDSRPKDTPDDPVSQKWSLTLVSVASSQAKPAIYRVDRERGVLERIQNATASLPAFPLVTKIERLSSHLTVARIWRTDRWLNEPNWLAAQTLAAVTYHEEDGFKCTVRADRLPLPMEASE